MAKDKAFNLALRRLSEAVSHAVALRHVAPRVGIHVNLEAEFKMALAQCALAFPEVGLDDAHRRAFRFLLDRG